MGSTGVSDAPEASSPPVLSYHHISVLPRELRSRTQISLPVEPGRLHCPRAGGSAGAGEHRLNCAFCKQNLHARKGQPALQDPPASLDAGPRGAGTPRSRGSLGVLRPRPPREPMAPSLGPRPPPEPRSPQTCPAALTLVGRRSLATRSSVSFPAAAAARPPGVHGCPRLRSRKRKPRG